MAEADRAPVTRTAQKPKRYARPQKPLQTVGGKPEGLVQAIDRLASILEPIEEIEPYECQHGLGVDEPGEEVEELARAGEGDRPCEGERRRTPLELGRGEERCPSVSQRIEQPEHA